MKLNDTNRRRSLKRRRKLMPEPRTISGKSESNTTDRFAAQAPAERERNDVADLSSVQVPAQEAISVEN
jgi:hypothetical protein